MNLHEELPNRTIGVVSSNGETMEIKTMADKMFTCIAKNYKIDSKVKQELS